MNFEVDPAIRRLAEHVKRAVEECADDRAAAWRHVAGLGVMDIELSDSDGVLQAFCLSQALGEVNAPFSVANHLVARSVLVAGGDGRCAELLRDGGREPAPIGIGYGLAANRAAIDLLVDEPKAFLVADRERGWLLVDAAAVGRSWKGAWNPEQSVGIVEWPADAGRVVLDERWEWQTKNLVLQTADLLGALRAMLDRTVEYAKQRRQFDRPIGSFQAIQHRLADDFADLTACQALAEYAAWNMGRPEADPESRRAWVHAARALAGEASLRIIRDTFQFHGGIAMTADFWVHRWVRRAARLALYMGPPRTHFAALGESLERGLKLRVAVGETDLGKAGDRTWA